MESPVYLLGRDPGTLRGVLQNLVAYVLISKPRSRLAGDCLSGRVGDPRYQNYRHLSFHPQTYHAGKRYPKGW